MELLLTFPITAWQAIVGKFLASWLFLGIALMLTFPIVITVNHLGNPDNGLIFAAYMGSFLMAGAYLAIPAMMFLAVMMCLCSEADAFVAASFTKLHVSAKVAFLVLGPMLDLKLYMMFIRVFRLRLIRTIVIALLIQVYILSLAAHFVWTSSQAASSASATATTPASSSKR